MNEIIIYIIFFVAMFVFGLISAYVDDTRHKVLFFGITGILVGMALSRVL